jgi:hypothetical protein
MAVGSVDFLFFLNRYKNGCWNGKRKKNPEMPTKLNQSLYSLDNEPRERQPIKRKLRKISALLLLTTTGKRKKNLVVPSYPLFPHQQRPSERPQVLPSASCNNVPQLHHQNDVRDG